MRRGVNVPYFGPGTNPDVLRGWALTVEGLGFDLLMMGGAGHGGGALEPARIKTIDPERS